ncbi:MAG: PhoU domain-containing protein [Clostridia bacterium]|nr:PhoU domain-containing protein [Clostridia bacterium]
MYYSTYLIRLSADVEGSDEGIIGSYFHVLNDLERIGDHLINVGYSIVDPTGSQS